MNLQYRIELLARLGEYILADDEPWQAAKRKAGLENGWFTPAFTDIATREIAASWLQKDQLQEWVSAYQFPEVNPEPRQVGIVMAGNIPLVGFHDWLCVFITGNKALVKLSSKDSVLLKHLVEVMEEWEPAVHTQTAFSEMLKGCDAYIATGSNNSSRYFDYYFGKYPHIIRRNRTSVAILTGNETTEELKGLSDDIHLFFGMGCRNVTKLYVPEGYDFVPLINVLKEYSYLADEHKYKNNYDYNLALHILNNKYYMSSGAVLLVEDPAIFSPVSQVNYEFYADKDKLETELKSMGELQCITGRGHTPFGNAQKPSLSDYADGEDTLAFLKNC